MHWAGALAIVIGVGCVLWRNEVEARAWRALLLDTHRWAGVAALMLAWGRLSWRRLNHTPPAAPGSRTAQRAAAAMHAALYVGMLSVPLLGWGLSEARGLPLEWFGTPLSPGWVSVDPDLADDLQSIHATAAWVLVGAATAHTAAALWHHFALRDGLLRRMT